MAYNKIVAIYDNHQNLKDVVENLDRHGIRDVSVLIRQQPDESTRDDIPVDEVRTYSSATYAGTRPKLDYRKPELHDASAYATQTGAHTVDDRFLVSGAATPSPGPDSLVPALENANNPTPDQLPLASESTLDTGIVDEHRIDQRLKDHGDVSIKDPDALKKDAVKGGLLGLLAGAASLLIPGIGPVVAAGPIAAGIAALAGGAALGTAAGALVGLLQDEGIPDDRVADYRRAFEAGKGIVIVRMPGNESQGELPTLVQDILHQHYPDSVEVMLR